MNVSFHLYKQPGQGCWKPQYPKKLRNSNQTGNGNRQSPIGRNPRPSCTYCGCEGHMVEVCYKNIGTCFHCGRARYFAKQYSATQLTTSETPRGVGRPPNTARLLHFSFIDPHFCQPAMEAFTRGGALKLLLLFNT
ncbi:hypothetical protein M9H77_14202 [Catharanthus roseus]|uniref:Uncharacterized protein n=1 Tax=Catharanthus roseus TaxID=4058 RepID=A0ACC0BMJ7_CATRO|nr:hypothetical protein M9H77_14202 [Catharanthus roseus]